MRTHGSKVLIRKKKNKNEYETRGCAHYALYPYRFRCNLLRQAGEAKGSIDAHTMMHIRDVCWENGGATFCHSILFGKPYSTNHQVVFVSKSRTLWMKTMDKDWQKVELGPLFGMSNEGEWGALKREAGIV